MTRKQKQLRLWDSDSQKLYAWERVTPQSKKVGFYSHYSPDHASPLSVLRQENFNAILMRVLESLGYEVFYERDDLSLWFSDREKLLWGFPKSYSFKTSEMDHFIETGLSYQLRKLSSEQGLFIEIGQVDHSLSWDRNRLLSQKELLQTFFLSHALNQWIGAQAIESYAQNPQSLLDLYRLKNKTQFLLHVNAGMPDLMAESHWASFAMDVDDAEARVHNAMMEGMNLPEVFHVLSELKKNLSEVLDKPGTQATPSAHMVAQLIQRIFNDHVMSWMKLGRLDADKTLKEWEDV